MYNVLYIQKTHHDLLLSGPILHRKCSVRNKMFGFALALNLNLHSGSCSVVLLNLTPNIMFGSGSNIVRNVWNRTVASLSCVETSRILLQFGEDLSGVKSLLRVAYNLPEGIPSPQWDRILRGESVDLHQILSSMHFVQLNEERKGRLGAAEVVFTVAESKRQVKTGSEWSAAYRRMAKAVSFLFPHRREELSEYAEHIEGLFSAKHTNAHSKVILYDQSVRNQVGGGQNILLTDYQRFGALSEAILHADGIEYRGSGKGPSKGGKGSDESGSSKKEVCRRFNSQDGCKFTEEECYYKHTCKKCGGKHGRTSCTAEKN